MEQDERPLTTSDLASGGDRGEVEGARGGEMQHDDAARGGGAETSTTPAGESQATEVQSRPAMTATDERPSGETGEGEQSEAADEGGTADLTGHRAGAEEQPHALFAEDDTGRFRSRWEEIQADFVDDPRGSVERADRLVAEVMQHLASTFSRMRADLESQWYSGGEAGTEDLRVALRRYRSFFELLLRR